MIRSKIRQLVEEVVKKEVDLERPVNPKFGDYSTNIALKEKIEPEKLIKKLKDNSLFTKIEKAGQGFINFYLSPKALYQELIEILRQNDIYGQLELGRGQRVQVEFISANPTGPLTVGNARGGPFGDVLANVLKKAGFQAEKAYYVNDYGQQILALGHSVLQDQQARYKGDYIDQLSKKIQTKDPYQAGQTAARYIIKDYIQKTTHQLGIQYDEWIFESDLHQSSRIDKVLKFLKERDLIYSKDGAEWFNSSQFGDSRDRVLVKSDGQKTYLAGDIALHYYKFKEKQFDKVINIWGADHHGDIPGLLAGVTALGYKNRVEIILLQFVTILEKNQKQKMSKRAGFYVAMDELLEKAGRDAVRFFFLQKSPDTHLNFDMSLAQEQSSKNPVYYVQYAHARIHSILTKSKAQDISSKPAFQSEVKNFERLIQPTELALLRQLIRWPEIIEDTARDYQVQRLPYYSLELANRFHQFYEECRILDEQDKRLSQARLFLVKGAKVVLKNSLTLMGLSAPEQM